MGFCRPGPGTWASVAATLLWLAVVFGLHPGRLVLGAGTGVAALVALGIGIPAATIVERETGGEDPQHVVLDEVAGQWIALTACVFAKWPSGVGSLAADRWMGWHALAALALFRLLDITKPPPARQLERLHGGAGIMLDDVAAGVYALVVLAVVELWW